jgi:hypothetical protein
VELFTLQGSARTGVSSLEMTSSGARYWVISGILVIALAVVFSFAAFWKSSRQADRDFAACEHATQLTECDVRQQPISVVPESNGEGGIAQQYELVVQLGPHTTFALTGLTMDDASQLQGVTSMDVLYRNGHAVALVTPGRAVIEIPFALTHAFWMTLVKIALFGLFGLAVIVWGIVRATRRPRLQQFAY